MQCFQKDPNLRVSAKKLLKHPWIVNARRSDSIVPKKSTEYEEAVRSVQEWNEAVRFPETGDFRMSLRTDSNAQTPVRQDALASREARRKDSFGSPATRKLATRFRSPESTADENWDDDFATAISPSALHLPHLRPQDNFGGKLSSEKLKAFASLDGTVSRPDDGFEDWSVRNDSFQMAETDPLETIRPLSSKQASANDFAAFKTAQGSNSQIGDLPFSSLQSSATPSPNGQQPVRHQQQLHPASFDEANSDEQFSDLVVADKAILNRKVGARYVSVVFQ